MSLIFFFDIFHLNSNITREHYLFKIRLKKKEQKHNQSLELKSEIKIVNWKFGVKFIKRK